MDRMDTPGKVLIYNRETGEQREHWPIDARGIVAAEGSPWQFEPVAVPWTRAKVPASSAATGATSGAESDPKEPSVLDEDLEALTKDQLIALAEKRGLSVTRGDGKDGDPVRADYIKALSA